MDDLADRCPLRYFRLLPDPRAANVRHRLVDILLIALCAMICDADGWDDLEDFARAKASWFATFLDLRHGVPCADTFRRVISRLDPEALERCFMGWMAAVVEQSRGRLVAIDGKSLRRSFEQGWDKSGMAHRVSAFATHNGQTLAQLKTDGQGKELDGIKQLLGLIDLRDVTFFKRQPQPLQTLAHRRLAHRHTQHRHQFLRRDPRPSLDHQPQRRADQRGLAVHHRSGPRLDAISGNASFGSLRLDHP